MERKGGGDANNWLLCAIAEWHLGRRKEARRLYDRSVPWIKDNQPDDDDLARLRDEVKELLDSK